MSANPNLHPAPGEHSAEQLFFVVAIAFLALVALIVAGAFMPVAVGVGVSVAGIVVAVAVVLRFLLRMLED
jgi:Flp pilus assembly protein TadB